MATEVVRAPTAFGYGRASKSVQVLTGEVQEQQVTGYYDWKLKPIGVPWGGWYMDQAVSSRINWKDRPAGKTLAGLLRRGDHIVIAKYDRAFRSMLDSVTQTVAWQQMGVVIHYLDIGIDTSTPTGELLLGIYAVFAQFERRRIAERTKDALKVHREKHPWWNGYRKGGIPPVGFKFQRNASNRIRVVPNPEEIVVLNRIYEMFLTRKISGHRIATVLIDEGVFYRGTRINYEKVYQLCKAWRTHIEKGRVDPEHWPESLRDPLPCSASSPTALPGTSSVTPGHVTGTPSS